MKVTRVAALLIFAIPPIASSLGAETDDGFVPLFNGRTLHGWRQLGGHARFAVEDGMIVGTSAPNTSDSFLCTEKTYGDFVLDLEFKVDDGLNSGIQVRSNSIASYKNGQVHGYQVEIDPSPRAWTGGIYDESRRGWLNDLTKNELARKAFKHNQWNAFHIECVGDHIRTWINGIPAADLRDSMTHTGFIGLQVHGFDKNETPLHVRFRGIRLKALDAPAR
jgi:hypothetical protein